MHAEFIRGTAHELAHHHIPARGEFTVVVGPSDIVLGKDRAAPADEDIAASFWRMSELNATSRRDAVRRVSVLYGISPNDVYLAVERTKSLAKQPTSAS
jgi:hypothetical protein